MYFSSMPPPPPSFAFGRPPNFTKTGKTLRACAQMQCVLVVNSYLDTPPPLSFRNHVSAPELLLFIWYVSLWMTPYLRPPFAQHLYRTP